MSGVERNPVSKAEKTRTRYLVVMGIAGTGKTEVGKRLANALGPGSWRGTIIIAARISSSCAAAPDLPMNTAGPGSTACATQPWPKMVAPWSSHARFEAQLP